MLLYYGADRLVNKPEYGKGNIHNDYGLGFYMTDDKEMAKLWASRFTNGGYCITYNVDLNNLKVLYLEDNTDESVLKWISLLVKNRFSKEEYETNKVTIDWLNNNYKINTDEYDAIVGYRADDSYFAYSRDFVSNDLSLELLTSAMKLGELGKQYVLKSLKSFKHIEMVEFEKVPKTDEYEKFRIATLNEYHSLKRNDDINNTYIRDIMRKK